MFEIINYEDIGKNRINESHTLIDVRSPCEYDSETIPGAINIPLFNDEERKLIGTIYNQESVEKAKKIGIETASNRLPNIYNKVSSLDKQYNNLIFFCARGGFRSSSLVSLFKSLGINATKLNGGYKGYRRYINENLPSTVKEILFIVLYGNTGTGKTDILKSLRKKGVDVLDLEDCANHRGSLLGNVGLGKQNTQKMFESLIYESLRTRKTNLVFIEGESKKIGRNIIPNYLYNSMNKGINLRIEASMETRIDNLLKDYVHETDNELISSLNFLRKYLGNKNINKYIELISKQKYREVIQELMIKYYDPLYNHQNRNYNAVFYNNEINTTTQQIIEWTKKVRL
ncbi:tRNA 2-selenouridine(34) synthase MnmH [Tissierella sp. MSJ-40]|uniref:tRNA 2-selenouridine(34) synthase MnmH n=1 Tax=Tissierella simiarum TaxID=2841534 RepID=A0ABS6E8F0_9FIRM|nr:tRNA 2-selenouridine(34) synthase MnmH [Tissierella simiarum]MBU5439047.1 tRNA 2-selenouridine(34) synthase MnmH [Tissierella simiarum]